MTVKLKKIIAGAKSSDGLAGLALFIASLLFFYDLLGGDFLLTERDLGPYFIPPKFFWVDSINQGDFPLWNPFQFSGHPFFANPQHAILYPLNVLFFLLPFDKAFNAFIILHFFLGGLFTYLFLKDLRVSATGSLVSGLTFMLGGYLLSVHSLLTILLSVVWTPLIMIFFRRALAVSGVKNEILTAFFVTLSFLGGGIEIVYGNLFVLLFMVVFPLEPLPSLRSDPLAPPKNPSKHLFAIEGVKDRFIMISPRIKSLWIVLTVFLFLSAVQLLPFLELFDHSIRGRGISYREATVWSFAPKDVLLFFLPDAYGYFLDMKKYWVSQCWLKTLYTGGFPLVLSTFFFISGRNRTLFFSLMLFSLFLSLGQYNPLYPFVFKYLPFFNGIRYPVKFLYIFVLVLSITAGLGFQRLVEISKEGKGKGVKHVLIVLSLGSGILLLFFIIGHQGIDHFLRVRGVHVPDFNDLTVNLYHIKRFLFYLALFFLLLRVGHEVKWRTWAKVLVIFFMAADLFGNMGFYGRERTSEYFRKTRVQEIISEDEGEFKIFSTEKTVSLDTSILIGGGTPLDLLKAKHLPSMNLPYRLRDIWGIDVIRLKRTDDLYRAFTGTPSISSTRLIDLYGAKYIISVTPFQDPSRFELLYAGLEGLEGDREDLLEKNTIKLYRNRHPLPRAWLVSDFKVFESESILKRLTDREFRPGEEVLLEEEPDWGREDHPSLSLAKGELGTVEIVSESNNRLRLRVNATGKCLLVMSDTHYPGWKVSVDGVPRKLLRANYTFRAVPVATGTHHVEFAYDPVSVKLGAGVSFLGILGCISMIWIRRLRKA